jgi:hypothetical protein
MHGISLIRLGLGTGALVFALSALWAQQTNPVDVSGYPPEVQKQYETFAEKCSKCHDLSRPLSARYTTEAQWREMVSRMARKPMASISRKGQADITSFLVYYQKARSGSTASTASAAASTPGASGSAPAAAASTETAAPARAEGASAGGGLRVEVEASPAQPIVSPVDGRWTSVPPAAGDNLFLSVRLFDDVTGEKVPYATIRARVGGDSAAAARPLRPLFGGKGFQYGENFAAPAGDLQVSLEVEPPPLARVNDDGHRWSGPLNLKLTLHGR